MRVTDWFRLLASGGFRIHPMRYGMTFMVSGCSLFNSVAAAWQNLALRRRILATELVQPPVFIVGHWRSGTTLMHELFSLDDGWASPDNYDAFVPHHALATGWIFKGFVNSLLPRQRPMDSMELRAGAPQEDDFALVSLGAPTPYHDIAFCRDRHHPSPLLALDQAGADVQEQTRVALDFFFRMLTRMYGTRLVLKSPPHTGRVALLAQWFPGAKFVHMARNPLAIVPSTMKLWRALDETQGLQRPRYDDRQLLEYINAAYELMYGAWFRQRSAVPAGQICEVRFENLVEKPRQTIEQVFKMLQLDPSERFLTAVQTYFDQRTHHRTGNATEDPSLSHAIGTVWSRYRTHFGYSSQTGDGG